MGRELLKRTVVVIALDIEDDDTHVRVERLLLQELDAVPVTETVFEFDYAKCPYSLVQLRQKLSKIIDMDNDMVIMWDLDRPSPDADNEFFRTTVG